MAGDRRRPFASRQTRALALNLQASSFKLQLQGSPPSPSNLAPSSPVAMLAWGSGGHRSRAANSNSNPDPSDRPLSEHVRFEMVEPRRPPDPLLLPPPPPSTVPSRHPQCPLHPAPLTPSMPTGSSPNLQPVSPRLSATLKSFPKRTTIVPWSSVLTGPGTNSTLMYVTPPSTCSPITTSLTTPSCQNSNVVQFISLLKKDNKREQMVYYQARPPDRPYGTTLTLVRKTGIGTYVSKHGPGFFTPMVKKMSKLLDEAVAWNLASHTQCSYSIKKPFISRFTGLFVSWLRILDAALLALLQNHIIS